MATLFWKSNHYNQTLYSSEGTCSASVEPTGRLSLVMNLSVQTLTLTFTCRRNETMCYAKSVSDGQIMHLAIPLDGSSFGQYDISEPPDYGTIQFSDAVIADIKRYVPVRPDLVQPEVFAY
jgi:hypothetical protein